MLHHTFDYGPVHAAGGAASGGGGGALLRRGPQLLHTTAGGPGASGTAPWHTGGRQPGGQPCPGANLRKTGVASGLPQQLLERWGESQLHVVLRSLSTRLLRPERRPTRSWAEVSMAGLRKSDEHSRLSRGLCPTILLLQHRYSSAGQQHPTLQKTDSIRCGPPRALAGWVVCSSLVRWLV